MNEFALEWKDIVILAQLVVITFFALRMSNLVPQAFFKSTFDMLREMAARTPSKLDDQLVDVFDKMVGNTPPAGGTGDAAG